MSKTQPARGMRDFLPVDVRKREYVIGIIKEVYESYGFEPLETPAVENIETLTGKYGEEGNQLIYKILKRGEKLGESFSDEKDLADLALRYDLTVPLARVVANYKNDLPKFFKRYQIQPVWRADRPARGRYREFYQCDVDAIGSSSMIVEAELCAAVSEILTRLGFDDFVIRINHKEILRGILAVAGIAAEKHADALIALDKIDKIGREGVSKEFLLRNISNESGQKLLAFFDVFFSENWKSKFNKKQIKKLIGIIDIQNQATEKSGKFNEKINTIQKVLVKDEEEALTLKLNIKERLQIDVDVKVGTSGDEIINDIFSSKELQMIENYENLVALISIAKFIKEKEDDLENLGWLELNQIVTLVGSFGNSYLKIDPSLARGLSYYTGAIFEINVPDLAGSLGGGGRYDDLIGMFGKEQIPACGFSLGLERILVVMEERGMFPEELNDNSADVLVTVWNEETIGESLKFAGELRKENLRVLVYPETDKLGKQFKYAGQINVPFVCVLGETELAENKVTLKDMRTGEQETLSREVVAAKIK